MQSSGCKPDVVTCTALVTAYERGGQWVKALEVRLAGLGTSPWPGMFTLISVITDYTSCSLPL